MIDSVHQTAAAGYENPCAGIVNKRFFFDRAFEQFKNLAQTQVNDGVQSLTLDLFAGESGIVFEQNSFAGQAIAENAAAFFGF